MKLTRDSVLLSIGAAIAAVTYLLTMPPPTQWSYTDWLHAALGALLWLSGKAASSWLPGQNDANKVSGPRALPVVLLAALLSAGMFSIGCGQKLPPLVMPTSTHAIITDDASLRAYAQQSVGVLRASLKLAREINNAEKQVEIVMPPSARTAARAAMSAYVQAVIETAQWIETAANATDKATSIAQLKSKLDAVKAKASAMVDLVNSLPSSAQNRAGFGPLVSSLFGMVADLAAGVK